jgi:hypothetical protein
MKTGFENIRWPRSTEGDSMSVQDHAVNGVLEASKDGLPEQAGEGAVAHAAVDATNDGPGEREQDDKEIDAAARIDEVEAAEGDDEGEEIDLPQPLSVVEPPKDFDWRKLKPRVYGKSLRPLDPLDRQSLEAAIVRRGIDHEILIDELLNVIDGNARLEICLKTGIVPPVKMVSGLTNEEKEELAISSNVDRRQLRDPGVERPVREARLENMFKGRAENKKKFTLTRIARATGLSVATVSLRWRARQNSRGENASIGDARQLYGDDLKSEAVRLVEMGIAKADVARQLCMSPKAVERAVKKAKELEAGKAPAKGGKGKKAAAAQSAGEIEDSAGVNSIPELHRPFLEWLDLDAEKYASLDADCREQAREEIEKVFTNNAELLRYAVYGKYLRDFAHELLEERCGAGADEGVDEEAPGASSPDAGGYEADEEFDVALHVDEPDDAPVSLLAGDRGAIAEGDNGVARLAVAEKGDEARVWVNGFDPEAGHPDRESVAQDDRTRAAEPILDDRSSPYEKHFGRKGEPKK